MRITTAAAIVTLLLASAHFAKAQLQPTVDVSQYGWLEGTITNNQGQAIMAKGFMAGGGEQIKGVRQGGGEFEVQADPDMGGLFSVKNIKPGIYDLTLEKGVGWQSNDVLP